MKNNKDNLVPLSELCREVRILAQQTPTEFAKDRGVSFSYVYKVEAGKMDTPSIAILTKLIRVYNLSKEDLGRTTVGSSFIDDASVFSSILHPISNAKILGLKEQIKKITDKEFGAPELKEYTTWDIKNRIFAFDKSINITFNNKKKRLNYIYDAKGTDKDGNVCFLVVFDSSQRLFTDDKYIAYIVQLAKMVEGSIQSGSIDDKDLEGKKINITFATSSIRGYKLAQKYLRMDSYTDQFNISRNIIFFDNRKGPKNKS